MLILVLKIVCVGDRRKPHSTLEAESVVAAIVTGLSFDLAWAIRHLIRHKFK